MQSVEWKSDQLESTVCRSVPVEGYSVCSSAVGEAAPPTTFENAETVEWYWMMNGSLARACFLDEKAGRSLGVR